MSDELRYLNDLSRIIGVHPPALGLAEKHLEITPILVEGSPLSLLQPLHQIGLTDPVKKRHHRSFVTVLWQECRSPFPPVQLVAEPVSCQLN